MKNPDDAKRYGQKAKKAVCIDCKAVDYVVSPRKTGRCRSCSSKMIGKSHRGRKLSHEHRKSIGKSLIGKFVGRKFKPETIEKMRISQTGKKLSEETKKKVGLASRGDKNARWKGGITPEIKRLRNSTEYKLWRKSVFERDNYTCVWCGAKNGGGVAVVLNADHIKPFAHFPELRFAIDNGRTLCVPCHKTTDTFGNRYKS